MSCPVRWQTGDDARWLFAVKVSGPTDLGDVHSGDSAPRGYRSRLRRRAVRTAERLTTIALSYAALMTAAGTTASSANAQARNAGTADSAGVQIVLAGTSSVERRVRLVFRSDSMLPSPVVLERVVAVLETPSGKILAFDRRASDIKLFSAAGEYERTLGRRGGGPGEFAGPLNHAWIGLADTIFIADPGNGRVQAMDSRGRALASWELPPGDLALVGASRDGTVTAYYFIRVPGTRPTMLSSTIAFRSLSRDGSGELRQISTGGEPSLASPSSRPAIAVGPVDRVCVADASKFEIRCFDGQYRLRQILRRKAPPDPLRMGDLDLLLERSTLAERRDGAARMMHSMLRNAARAAFPATYPRVSKLIIDDRGRLWVGRHATAEYVSQERVAAFEIDNPVGSHWEVFDLSGYPLFQVRLPARFRLSSVRGDALLGYEIDDTHGPRVVKLMLVN